MNSGYEAAPSVPGKPVESDGRTAEWHAEREGQFIFAMKNDSEFAWLAGNPETVRKLRRLWMLSAELACPVSDPPSAPTAGPTPKPDFWWNGAWEGHTQRDAGRQSFSRTEDAWHDIPCYAGTNPANAAGPADAGVLMKYVRHGVVGGPICASMKHSDWPCDCGLDAALNALRSQPKETPGGWRPMETAPRDRTPFLALLEVENDNHKWREVYILAINDETGALEDPYENGNDTVAEIDDYTGWIPMPRDQA